MPGFTEPPDVHSPRALRPGRDIAGATKTGSHGGFTLGIFDGGGDENFAFSKVADCKNMIDEKKKAPVKGPISLVVHHVVMMMMMLVVVVVHFAGAGD
jgi:hypothetical protein